VTVRCGDLVATHLGLGRLAVRHGARVVAGARLGVVGPAGRLRLGARRRSARFGYVDPLALLGAVPPPVGRGPAPPPLGRAPRSPVAPRHAPPLGRRAPHFAPAAAPQTAGVPVLAWGGLVILAAGLPLGGLVHRRRRRRAAARALTVPAAGR
jgi:hypothetical protein